MTFHPPLASTTFIPLSSSSLPSSPATPPTLHFTYLPPATFPSGANPEIWTNLPGGDGQWHALAFSPSSASSSPALWTASIDLSTIKEPENFEYTYRLRLDNGELQWLGLEGGNGKVEVVGLQPPSSSSGAPHLIAKEGGRGTWEELGENVALGRFRLKKGKSGIVETVDITGLVANAGQGWGGWRDGEGVVWEQSSRTWLVPRVLPIGRPLESLSQQFPAQLLILRSSPSAAHPLQRNLVIFPFSTTSVCSTLVGAEGGRLHLQFERDSPSENAQGHAAVAWGEEGQLQQLIASCVAAARSILLEHAYEPPIAPAASSVPASIPRTPPHPLGLCTWNALGPSYTLSDVLSWLDSLVPASSDYNTGDARFPSSQQRGAAIKTLLLDDGWQDTATYIDYSDPAVDHPERSERRALKSFGTRKGWCDIGGTTAAPSAAPSGAGTPRREKGAHQRSDSGYGLSPDMSLATVNLEDLEMSREGVSAELCDAVRRVKERGIERVGVWMTILGYWHGIHPDGALGDSYDFRLTTFRSSAHPNYSYCFFFPSPADLPTFYRDYFSSLKAAGVDFVKMDDQATVDALVSQEGSENSLEHPADPGQLKHLILSSMREAALAVFGPPQSADLDTSLAHCMAGSPRIWGGSLGIVGSSSSGTRALVRNSDDYFPDAADSHRWHLAHNAIGSVLSSNLRFAPCFDMAQEKHEYGEAHLALRAFSSAPIWSTDVPEDAARTEEGEDEAAGREGKQGKSGWGALLASTKAGPRVIQSPKGTGAVLEGRLMEDVVARYGPSCATSGEALKVGLAFEGAKGAHLGLWNTLPEGHEAQSVLDTKDLGDCLGELAAELSEDGSNVVVFGSSGTKGEQPLVQQLTAANVDSARRLHRSLAAPISAVKLERTGVEVFTLAKVYSLPLPSGGECSIACLGLLDKTVGLAAVRGIQIEGVEEETAVEEETQGTAGEEAGLPPGPALDPASSSVLPTPPSLDEPVPQPVVPPRAALVASSPSPPTRPSRPVPSARLPFLLAYLTGFLRLPLSTPSARARTPTVELRSLLSDLFRRPLRTLFSEVGAVVSFGFAAVVWALGGTVKDGQSEIEEAPREELQDEEPPREQKEEEPVVVVPSIVSPVHIEATAPPPEPSRASQVTKPHPRSPKSPHLSLQLDFVSPRLGFYVAGLSNPSCLRFCLDGHDVPSSFVKQGSQQVVEVDVEGAWRAEGGKGEAVFEPWKLTVEAV
ncbi:hypothetical protein JCM11641_004584 [Rhodosporidiobolus odoratus]